MDKDDSVYNINSRSYFKQLKKDIMSQKILIFMMLPGAILIFLFSYLPMFGIIVAFKQFSFGGKSFFENLFVMSKWVGLDNFKFFIKTPDAYTITRNTILYNIVFITFGNLVAIFCAIGLNEIRKGYLKRIYQSSMLLPYFLSWIVLSYLFFGFLSFDKGIFNSILVNILGTDAVNWYAEPKYWPYFIIFANRLKYCGYDAIIYLATLTAIDITYYEAAIIDGANKWKQIIHITIPLLSPVMIILILYGIGRIFNADFGLFFNLPLDAGALFDSTNVIDTYVYRSLRTNGDIAMASAAGLYQSVVGFVLVVTANSIVKKIDPEKALF